MVTHINYNGGKQVDYQYDKVGDLVKNYTGHDYDSVLSQYYAKARMYDAGDRRFTSVDPILDATGYDIKQYLTNPEQLVQYLYVINNPLIPVDPDGRAFRAYVLEKKSNGEYRQVGSGTLNDVRFADNGLFNIVDVANLISSISGYRSWGIRSIGPVNKVTLNVNSPENEYKFTGNVDKMKKGVVWFGQGMGGQAVDENGQAESLYFAYYRCINGDERFYVSLMSMAYLMDKVIVIENMDNHVKIANDNKVHVIGAQAMAQAGFRVNASLGLGWDGSGTFGYVTSLDVGGGWLGAGFSGFYAEYNTNSLNNINGVSFQMGDGFTLPTGIGAFGLGYDYEMSLDGNEISGQIWSASYSVSMPPFPLMPTQQYPLRRCMSRACRYYLR